MGREVTISQWDKLSDSNKKTITKVSFPGKARAMLEGRPSMAFATICKDEEHCIGKTLNAVKDYVDYVVVADNGSTDGTFGIVRSFFEDTNIPGAWHIDEWEGFGKTKTKMMAHVKGKTDYVIHLDADDFLEGELDFNHQIAGADKYAIINKRGGSSYWCSVIYNNKLTWSFYGVAHTIIQAEERLDGAVERALPEDDVWIANSGTGVRAMDPNKFLSDALKLSKQYEDTLIADPDGLNVRSVFYCAQSYRDQGGVYLVDALKWYSKYMTLKHSWFEEEYEAQLSIARIKAELNDTPTLGYTFTNQDIANEYHKAISIIDDRAEAYFRLGKLYNNTQQYEQAYDILSKGKSISLNSALHKYNLFIIPSNYELFFNDELSVACYWLNKKKEGVSLINRALKDPAQKYLSDHYKTNLEHFKSL